MVSTRQFFQCLVFCSFLVGSGLDSPAAVPPSITSVTVTAAYANMPAGQILQFHARVTGTGAFNPAVKWTVGPAGIILPSYGTITSSGMYTSPSNVASPTPVNITATSVEDPTQSGIGSVQVFPKPVISSLSPSRAHAGDIISIIGNNLDFLTNIYFTGPNHMVLPVASFGPSVPVPFSALTGEVSIVTQMPGFKAVVSNSIQFTRIPALRIRAAKRDLASGETTTVAYRILPMPIAKAIDWTADVGTIDNNGSYQAPDVRTNKFAHIRGCILGTKICQEEILGLHPFLITPYPATVWVAGSLQLDSVPDGAVWRQLAGTGSLTSGGRFTAGSKASDSGGIPISATLGGATEDATLGVRGGVPGVVSEISDYFDYNMSLPGGTEYEQVAVSGDRLYALAGGNAGGLYEETYFWIDVYDITNPVHPVWIDAVECAAQSALYTYGHYLYQIGPNLPFGGDLIAVFDVSGKTPVLIAEKEMPTAPEGPGLIPYSYFGGILYALTAVAGSNNQVTISKYDLRNGGIPRTDYRLAIPNGAGPSSTLSSVPMGTDARLYLFNTVNAYTESASSELDTYDVMTKPKLLETQPITPPYYNNLFMGTALIVGSQVYDLSNGLPEKVSKLPLEATGTPIDFNGTELLTSTISNGMRVTDLSDLASPKLTGVLYDPTEATSGVWSGRFVFTSNGAIRVFDARPPGGGLLRNTPVGPFLSSTAYDSVVYGSHLFEAIATDHNAFVSILDAAKQPLKELSEFDTGSDIPMAVQVMGNTMYVGTDQSLIVVDISNIEAPKEIKTIKGSVNALCIWGTHLYVGTTDGHLTTFSVATPNNPMQVSSRTLPTAAIAMRTSNGLLLIADDTSGLLTYSLASPSAPFLVSKLQPDTPVGDVAIDGHLAFLATSGSGLLIADIANPAKPELVGKALLPVTFPGWTQWADGIALANKIAYVGTWAGGGTIYGFDYSSAAHPRLVSIMPEGSNECDSVLTLKIDGTNLFDGGSLDGAPFLNIDISHPGNVIDYDLLFASAYPRQGGNDCSDEDAALTPRRLATYASRKEVLRKRLR